MGLDIYLDLFASRYIITAIHLRFGGWLYDVSAE